ncbi:3869_t:CDS:1, partial [Scutellospora calospora]
SINDWNIILELIHKYERASNTVINKEKITLAPLTTNVQKINLTSETNLNKISEDGNIIVLGYTVDTRGNSKKNLWKNMISKIKKLTEKYSQQNLSFKRRILIANSLLL